MSNFKEFRYIEDMIYPGTTILTGSTGDPPIFFKLLNDIKASHRFEVKDMLLDSRGWNRDPLLRTMNGLSLYSSENKEFYQNKILDCLYSKKMRDYSMTNGANAGASKDYNFSVHREPIAGGNIITALNCHGKLKFIVGEVAVPSISPYFQGDNQFKIDSTQFKIDLTQLETATRRLKNMGLSFNVNDKEFTEKCYEMYALWKNAKYRIRSLLLNNEYLDAEYSKNEQKSVLFVPHWAYHIDLQMLYVGQGRILIHSFDEQIKLIEEYIKKLNERKKNILQKLKNEEQFEEQLNKFEKQLNEIIGQLDSLLAPITKIKDNYNAVNQRAIATLKKHGFQIFETAGVFPCEIKDGRIIYNEEFSKYYFCFLNGISIYQNKVLIPNSKDMPFVKYSRTTIENIKDDDIIHNSKEVINEIIKEMLKEQNTNETSKGPTQKKKLNIASDFVGFAYERFKDLLENKLEITFIPIGEVNTNTAMLENGGGLRCKINTVVPPSTS